MFELLLTRLQARRLAATVLALDTEQQTSALHGTPMMSANNHGGSALFPETPLQPTPSVHEIAAVRDRVRRLQDVLDLSVAHHHLPADSPTAFSSHEHTADSTQFEFVNVIEVGQIDKVGQHDEPATTDEPQSQQNTEQGWNVVHFEEDVEGAHDSPRGSPAHAHEMASGGTHDGGRAASTSPMSTDSAQSIEGELDLVWRGVASSGTLLFTNLQNILSLRIHILSPWLFSPTSPLDRPNLQIPPSPPPDFTWVACIPFDYVFFTFPDFPLVACTSPTRFPLAVRVQAMGKIYGVGSK